MKHSWILTIVLIISIIIISIIIISIKLAFFIAKSHPLLPQSTNHGVLILKDNLHHQNAIDQWKDTCRFHSCFEINNCQLNTATDTISVYVYPGYIYQFSNQKTTYLAELSKEYQEVLAVIQSSKYYVSSAADACVFVPSIDLLNQRGKNTTLISFMLQALPL